MSTTLDNIQIQINILQNEKGEAERNYQKYRDVVSRLDDILFQKTLFINNRVDECLEYISDHYIGANGVYDRMERNPASAEGKAVRLFVLREQESRKKYTDFFSKIQESYGGIARQRNYAVVLRDEYQRTIAIKEQAVQEQQQAYRAQEERERREREEAARRAAEEAARRAAEQQKAAQEAAERLAAQRTINVGRRG